MESLKQKIQVQEISDNSSEISTTDASSCKSVRVSNIDMNRFDNVAEKLIELNRRENQQKITEAKISLMHQRWDGKIPSIYSKDD